MSLKTKVVSLVEHSGVLQQLYRSLLKSQGTTKRTSFVSRTIKTPASSPDPPAPRLPFCSALSPEVGLQHSGYRERKDQTDPVGPGPVGPVGPDQLTQEVPVTGNQIVITHIHHFTYRCQLNQDIVYLSLLVCLLLCCITTLNGRRRQETDTTMALLELQLIQHSRANYCV